MRLLFKNILIFCALIISLELSCFLYYKVLLENSSWVQGIPQVTAEDLLSSWSSSGLPPWTHKVKQGVFQNKAQYTIAQDGLRVDHNKNGKIEEEIFLFGGSLIFGYGVNDNETIDTYLRDRLSQKTFIKNFGLNGAGPDHHLITLKKSPQLIRGKTEAPIGIYFFLSDHINRVNWNFFHSYFSRLKAPYYYLQNNELMGGRPLFNENKLLFSVFSLVKASHTLRVLLSLRSRDITEAINFSQHEVKLLAKIIHQLRIDFLIQNPKGHFLVFSFDPTNTVTDQLEKEGIFFDNEIPIHQSLNHTHFQPDGHFNAKGNKRVAQLIHRYIRLSKTSNK